MLHALECRSLFRKLATCVAVSGAGLLLAGGAARAQIQVTPTVQQTGQIYQYDYSVSNMSADTTYYVVSLQGPYGSDAITDLMAPDGFQINFDPNLGLVTFLADTQSFDPGTTTSGFIFDSLLPPGSTTVESTGLDGLGNGVVTDGSSIGPVATPEPGVSALLLACATTAATAAGRQARRRRRTA